MPDMVYIVEFITRAHSSGHENKERRLFRKIEDASKYMMEVFELYGFDEDNDGDLFVNSEMEEHAPNPTMELAKQLFNPDALQVFLNKCKLHNTIYGPYSEFCCHVPFEMFFTYEEIM
jgi:hypothetical protein